MEIHNPPSWISCCIIIPFRDPIFHIIFSVSNPIGFFNTLSSWEYNWNLPIFHQLFNKWQTTTSWNQTHYSNTFHRNFCGMWFAPYIPEKRKKQLNTKAKSKGNKKKKGTRREVRTKKVFLQKVFIQEYDTWSRENGFEV